MKQGPARKAFSLWYIAGLKHNQFFPDAKVDHSKVPSAGREESWLGDLWLASVNASLKFSSSIWAVTRLNTVSWMLFNDGSLQ